MNSSPFLSREPVAAQDVQFHVVVPFYNAQKWITRCLGSIAEQTHPKVNVLCMDDASKDSGGTYAEMYCNHHDGWRYHRNETNLKCPRNLVEAMKLLGKIDQRDVIFLLDGDDYLPHPGVLTRMGELFGEADIWMTYGQYMSDPPDWHCAPAVPPPSDTLTSREWRSAPMFFNHPIVFRKFLWDSIPEDAFKDGYGNWFTAGYDRTIIYPLIERSTLITEEKIVVPHWRFINEVAYVYNAENPISEWRVVKEAAEAVNEVHNRPPLPPLNPRYYG